MIKPLAFGLLSMLLPAIVHAAAITESQCGGVDLKSKFGPARNQGGGLCYAYVAADLVGQAIGLRPPDQVSARHVADVFNTARPAELTAAGSPESPGRLGRYYRAPLNDRFGGYEQVAARLYARGGRLCLESELRSNFPSSESATQLLNGIYDMEPYGLPPRRHNQGSGRNSLRLLPPTAHIRAGEELRRQRERQCREDHRLANVNVEEIDITPRNSKTVTLRESITPQTTARFLERAQSLLNQRQPFGIGYNFCPFMMQRKCAPVNGFVAHASIIVGRRWKNGRCEFQIRNSFGADFNECAPGKAQCENDGHQWVSAEELMAQTVSITSVSSPSEPTAPSSSVAPIAQ